jgi:transcriptional regulator with XRE-family HTH domain
VEPHRLIVRARRRAGLSQAELARRAATSQPTLSDYEAARKAPTATTLARILAACGERLDTRPAARPVRTRGAAELADAGRTLLDVLELAAELPTRHEPAITYPGLPRPARR